MHVKIASITIKITGHIASTLEKRQIRMKKIQIDLKTNF